MILRKIKKILLWFFLSLLFLILASWVFIQTEFGQNWLVRQVTVRLSKDLNTRVGIRHVDFSLFNRMELEGLLIEDRKHDTLLYAGNVRVRITDWFFLKDRVELKYIGLENGVIELNRTDSVWNYQFLVDYFSSPSGGSKKKSGTRIDLKKLEFDNVIIRQKDGWRGKNMIAAFGSLDLDARNIDISDKKVLINSLSLVDPVFSEYKYDGNRPKATASLENEGAVEISDSTLQWNAAGWIIKVNKLNITNGMLKEDRQSDKPALPYFDGNHIAFNEINASFSNIVWEKDTITAGIDLSSKERSGFEVKKLVADLKMTPREMTFSNLEIRTNNSIIRNFYRMSYDDFDDLGDYIHRVSMQGNFDGSEIDSDDIAYFAPAMQTWKKKITFSGAVRGTVDNLVGRDLLIQAGRNTSLNGDISMTGLPAIEETYIDFNANDFRTTYDDAVAIVPAVRKVNNPDLRKLQYLRFSGSFTGFIRDFVTYGTIETNLGTVKTDLNMKLHEGTNAEYSGRISTDHFQLGSFINDPNLGAIAMSGEVQGRGFTEKNRNAQLDGDIHFIEYNDYRYSNITVNGKIDKRMFNGAASINDPEAELTMNGLIDFNNPIPVFNFVADVKKANLKNLNLSRDDIGFAGKFRLDFTGDNIDNFLGDASINEASITKDGVRLPFDSLVVSSRYENNVKTLTARSNEFNGMISGEFSIRDLPDAFRLFLNKYYPAYIEPPKRMPESEAFVFQLSTQYVDEYVKLIDSTLSGFNNAEIKGSLNTSTNELTLEAEVPNFQLRGYNFDNVVLNAHGNSDSLSLSGGAKNINISDSLNIPEAVFSVTARNDISNVRIFTGANQAINQARLDANVHTYRDGVRIEFNPSSFSVNGKMWTIDDRGELEFRSGIPASGSLLLRESNQEIMVRSKQADFGDWNDLDVELKKVNLGDFAPFFAPKNRIEGLLSGSVVIENPTRNLYIRSDELLAENFRLDNDSLGDTRITDVLYDGKTKKLTAKVNTLNQENNLAADVNVWFDEEKGKDNRIALKARNFHLRVLERFLGDLFSDIQGYVTGEFDVVGEFDRLQVIGKGSLKDAGLKVNFTQCYYRIRDTEIELKPTEINMDGIVLTDPVTGNPVYISGGIEHRAFKDMFYDIIVSTRKPGTIDPDNNRPILMLNTTYNDNKQFFGTVKGTGSFSLSGPQSEMYMKIDAIASDTAASTVTIPSSESRESGIADFLVERKYGREMADSGYLKKSSTITYDVDVTANPKVLVSVVLDELTGDVITGRGNGALNIHSGSNEPLSIWGKFDITEGEYIYTFQPLLPKKPFKIRSGTSNYITWTGDPYAARINFEAVYIAEDVSFSPLVTSFDLDESLTRQREDVEVIIHLTDDLFKPKFRFEIDFGSNSVLRNNFTVAARMQQIEKNENEINRQVAYLIGFNSFAPMENLSSGVASTGGFGSAINELFNTTFSSLSGLIFNEINKKLNSELAKILKNDNINIYFSGSVYNRNLLNQPANNSFGFNQSNFNINVPISLFKDRFVITLGSTLDVPLQSTIQQTVQFLPDVTAEWLINESGTLRVSLFYRENLDYLTSNTSGAARNKRSGVSVAYRKEFDNAGELFSGKKRKKNRPAPATPNAPPMPDSTKSTSQTPVPNGGTQ